MKSRRDAGAAAEVAAVDSSRIAITGPLNFDTVPLLVRQLPSLAKTMQHPVVDCSAVTTCNSASLAFILEINRIMKQQNKSVRFEALPADVTTFARAYGADAQLRLAGLLPGEAGSA